MMDTNDELIEAYQKALDEKKGKTATTIGPHNKSGMTKRERARLKQKEQKKQTQDAEAEETPKEDKPAEEKQDSQQSETENKETPTETNDNSSEQTDDELEDSDINKDDAISAISEIVNSRLAFFNENLANVYRLVGNLVAHKKAVFNIFEVQEPEQKETNTKEETNTPPSQNASFKQSNYTVEMLKHIKLFEAEEQEEHSQQEKQEHPTENVELTVKFKSRMNKNTFTSNLVNLAKSLHVNLNDYSNIGKVCAVFYALISKYKELDENIRKVNEKIDIDEIEFDVEPIKMNINNSQLKQLYPYFKGTPAEKMLKVLNVFCKKNISSITSIKDLSKLIESLPTDITEETARQFPANNDSFTLTIPKTIFENKNFPTIWFGNLESLEKKQEKETEVKSEETENSETPNAEEQQKQPEETATNQQEHK